MFNLLLSAPTKLDVLLSFGAFFLLLIFEFAVRQNARRSKSFPLFKTRFQELIWGLVLTSAYYYCRSVLLLWSLTALLVLAYIAYRWFFKRHLFNRELFHLLLAYFLGISLFASQREVLTIVLLIVAVGDFSADVFGYFFSKGTPQAQVESNLKTHLFRAVVFIISSFVIIYLINYFKIFKVSISFNVLFLLLVTLIAIDWLNRQRTFWMFFGGVLFYYILLSASSEQTTQIAIGMFFALLVVVLSYKAKFLSLSGSVMTFILAIVVFGLGGWAFTVPMLTFFFLSSLLSKVGKKTKQKFKNTFEKSGVRDYAQVLANGGIPGILVILHYFWPSEIYYYLYLLSLAVATADTWSTELGVLSPGKPRLITTFKKVEPGISGAISVYGTLGGLLGSLLIFLSGLLFVPMSTTLFLILWGFAFLVDLLDSLIGATLQGQYRCNVCEKYTEKKQHCGTSTSLIQGFKLIDNDTVNLSANLLALLLFILFY